MIDILNSTYYEFQSILETNFKSRTSSNDVSNKGVASEAKDRKKKNIIIAEIPEKELNNWKEYLNINNTPKLTGGYGKREDRSEIYKFTDIKAAFERLSTKRTGDLQAIFRAYADMYRNGASYNYHDKYIKAKKNATIKDKVSKSISSNAGFSKFIPILLKELEN